MSTYLAIGTQLHSIIILLLSSKRPMNEIQVDIFQAQLLQTIIEAPDDVLGRVQVLPELGGDEEVLAADLGVRVEELLDAGADLELVLVEPGAVEVTVAGLEGGDDGAVRLAWLADAGEGAEAQGGHELAVVELDHGGVCHCGDEGRGGDGVEC